jgi:hypothetical protein
MKTRKLSVAIATTALAVYVASRSHGSLPSLS